MVNCFELFIFLKILALYCWERLRSLSGHVHEGFLEYGPEGSGSIWMFPGLIDLRWLEVLGGINGSWSCF